VDLFRTTTNAVEQLADLFRTTTKVKKNNVTRNRVQRCGDIQLVTYLVDAPMMRGLSTLSWICA